MTTNNGFLKRRRGILEHIQEGKITLAEHGAHDVIGLLADKRTGIWFGSARAFAANCGAGDVSERQARHLLESLEVKGYIKRFPRRRAHGNYPILINKYEVTFGAYTGMRLNASATIDWHNPIYEKCLEHGAEQGLEQGLEQGAEVAPSQEVEVDLKRENDTKAVRRTAENCVRLRSSPSFKKNPKTERLKTHLAAKIATEGERVQDWNWSEERLDDLREVFTQIGYTPDLNSPQLSASFLMNVLEVYEDVCEKRESVSRGNFCSKVIDRCMQYNKQYPDEGHYWPPDFQAYRDRVREAERTHEKQKAPNQHEPERDLARATA